MKRSRHVLVMTLVGLLMLTSIAQADAMCPKCQAPLQPGARFCTSCGQRLDAPAPPAAAPSSGSDPLATVVQVVAGHDKELTSAYGAIVYGSTIEIDSIIGSGFAISPKEFVTEAGVVAGAREISIRTAGGRTAPSRLVGYDPVIGVALLTAEVPDIQVLPRREGLPRLGEGLRALGFPSTRRAAGEPTSTPGVVSALHRGGADFHLLEDYIQTDASRPDGFSGGPVLDAEGRLVGMSAAGVSGPWITKGLTEGISLSIPVSWIDRSLEWIRSGSPPRAWIGICTSAADQEARTRHGLPAEVRRIVEEVFPGSPAATAGLRRGDGLLRIDGEGAELRVQALDRLLRAKPGERLRLDVMRRGTALEVGVTVAPRPEHPRLAALDTFRLYGGFETEAREAGIVVTRVLPGSPARDAKIVAGDTLLSLLTKKDLDRAERYNARWRAVRILQDVEERLATAYSDFDFFVGLRFRARDGERRDLFLYDDLVPPGIL